MAQLAVPHAVTVTGEIVHSDTLVSINAVDKPAIAEMRISAVSDRNARQTKFRCPFCEQPLYPHKGGTVHWQHFPNAHKELFCIYGSSKPLTKSQLEGLVYRGRQVGERHQEIVRKLVELLMADNNVAQESILTDTYMRPISNDFHGRYPDISFKLTNGKAVVFEVQTSPIFLYRIVERQNFYKAQNTLLIWITDDLKVMERLPAYVYDFLSVQSAAAFDLPQTLFEECILERKFKLRRTINLGTSLERESSVIEIEDLHFQRSTFARNWINKRSSFGSCYNVPADLSAELKKIAGTDNRFNSHDAAKLCDWLLSLATGRSVGYESSTIAQIVNAAQISNFGNQISKLLILAVAEFQPHLLEKSWVKAHAAQSAKHCFERELPVYGRGSRVDNVRIALLPEWVLPMPQKQNSTSKAAANNSAQKSML